MNVDEWQWKLDRSMDPTGLSIRFPRVYIILSCYGIYRSLHRYKDMYQLTVILSVTLCPFWPCTQFNPFT